MDRLLVFEYLHADARAFRQAPQSMRNEGQAMLVALLADAGVLRDVQVMTVLCESALTTLGNLSDCAEICRLDSDDDLETLISAASTADFVLPVAPECDGLLLNIATTLEPLPCTLLTPPLSVLSMCSDKLETWKVLHAAGIPMLPCEPVGQASEDIADTMHVFKPRLGAGCDGIQRGMLPKDADPQTYVQQPWISGRSLSVAAVSDGNGYLQLPAAEQHIRWVGAVPTYQGGTVPADIAPSVQDQVDAIVGQTMPLLGNWRGYVGIDLLLSDSDNTVYLNEINPRVCTSYIGYQEVLRTNLVGLMMGKNKPVTKADPMAVSFTVDGSTQPIA